MLFNSYAFLFVFLPLVLLGYYTLGRLATARAAMVFLLAASIGFYAYWNWRHVFILLGSIAFNYAIGRRLHRSKSKPLLVSAIVADLALLGYFKYSGFLMEVGRDLGLALPSLHVVLPIGISFYTFLQIAFLCDVYRGRADDFDLTRYSLFVSLFPHSLAGPLVHHAELMSQFRRPEATRWLPSNISSGLILLSIGLAKKVLIADTCAPWANALFDGTGAPTILEAWTGALAYTMQLYFDFSGYSDMAIGLGVMFNVKFPENFDAPYRAASIADFWRRWHITLSRWLRDYLYIPLGGSQRGPARNYLNLFLTMLLGGIWHGAGWTYVAWGAFHGALLVGCRLWSHAPWRIPLSVSRSLTFLAVVGGWVLFRSRDLDRAGEILAGMCDWRSWRTEALTVPGGLYQIALLALLLVLVNVAPTTAAWTESRTLTRRHAAFAALLFAASLFIMRDVATNLTKSEFIYFQF
jgi:D-alanyl-lipoteichoic acid acyltransferase DltB (MBOAT superfamily)